jgi:tRNA dimethylallyltransferase
LTKGVLVKQLANPLSQQVGKCLVIPYAPTDGLPYRITSIALVPGDRAQLHARIAARFKSMLELGLLEELRALREKYPLHQEMTSMRCVGYRQAWQFMDREISRDELLEKGIAATRQLAKRQLTWLRSMQIDFAPDCLAPDLHEQIYAHLKLGLPA